MTSYAAHAKAVVLTIERNGTMAYRFRAARQLHRTNSLPIFSVDTEEEAHGAHDKPNPIRREEHRKVVESVSPEFE